MGSGSHTETDELSAIEQRNQESLLTSLSTLAVYSYYNETVMSSHHLWILNHANPTAHNTLPTQHFLAKHNVIIMLQPPHSADMTPCEFSNFPNSKDEKKSKLQTELETVHQEV